MNTRIKDLRDCLKLSQEEFGNTIGVSIGAVSGWERSHRNIPESMKLLICLKFHVRREWLEHGVGEMFEKKEDPRTYSPDELVVLAIGKLFERLPESEKKLCLEFIHRLSENGGDVVDALKVYPEEDNMLNRLLHGGRVVNNESTQINNGTIRGDMNYNVKK